MQDAEMNFGFAIARVSTEQFALIDQAFEDNEPINLTTNLRFAVDKENRLIGVFGMFQFEQKQIPFIKIEISCHFAIAPDSWNQFMQEEAKIVVPKNFVCHLCVISVGTARGVLHAKTEGTKFNPFVLPTINVTEIIKDDVVFA